MSPQRPSVSRSRAWLAVLVVVVATIAAGTAPASAGRAPTPTPVLDPAGKIAFLAYHAGVQQVFTMNADGTGRKQITFNKTGGNKCDPVLSPNGTEVAYASASKMYVHTIGGSAEDVGPPPEGAAKGGGRRPAWLNDNTLVFGFSTDWMDDPALDADARFDLWMVTRDPLTGTWSDADRLTAVRPGASAFQPRFNAAGTWMSYTFRDVEVASSAADLYVSRVPFPEPQPAPPPVDGQAPAPAEGAPGVGTIGHVLMNNVGAYLSTWRADGFQIGFVKSCTGGIHVANLSYATPTSPPVAAATTQMVVPSGGCGLSFSRTDWTRLTYGDNTSKIYVVTNTGSQDDAVWGTPTSIGIGSQPSW